jgi:hypothetical protein
VEYAGAGPVIEGSSKFEVCILRIPLLKGEGAAKRRVRGVKKHLFTPHPARCASHPLPSGEGFAPKTISNMVVVFCTHSIGRTLYDSRSKNRCARSNDLCAGP